MRVNRLSSQCVSFALSWIGFIQFEKNHYPILSLNLLIKNEYDIDQMIRGWSADGLTILWLIGDTSNRGQGSANGRKQLYANLGYEVPLLSGKQPFIWWKFP